MNADQHGVRVRTTSASAGPTARSLSMDEEPDVPFSRAEEEDEQSLATNEKLAVSLLICPIYVQSYHVANQLVRKQCHRCRQRKVKTSHPSVGKINGSQCLISCSGKMRPGHPVFSLCQI